MQKYLVGAVGFLFWLAAIGLTIKLVLETTQDQSIVAMGVAGLAIGMSGFGLLLARHAWQKRAIPEMAGGVAMWFAGVVCLAFIEISFWKASYDQRYDVYTQEKTTREHAETLAERDWKALTTGQMPKSVAQLEALIEAKKMEPPVARSANCSAVTRLDSREPCREYFELQSQLAAAKAREALESRIKVEAPQHRTGFSSDVFAAAEIVAKWRGGDVRDWSLLIIFWSWLLVTLVRDVGLLVMNPLGRSQAKKEEIPVILPSEKVGQPVSVQRRAPLVPDERVLRDMRSVSSNAESHTQAPLSVVDRTQDSLQNLQIAHPGDAVSETPKPEEHSSVLEVKAEEPTPSGERGGGEADHLRGATNVIADDTVVAGPWRVSEKIIAETTKPSRLTRSKEFDNKKKSGGWEEKLIAEWRNESATELPRIEGIRDKNAPTINEVFASFDAWRILRGEREIHKKRLSRVLAGLRDMPPSKSGNRDGGGRRFDWLRVYQPQQKKARA